MGMEFRTQAADAGAPQGPVAATVELAKTFITENRLRAVVSKSPDLLQERQLPKAIGLFTQDVWHDFSECHEAELKAMGKEEKAAKTALSFHTRNFVMAHLPLIRADVG